MRFPSIVLIFASLLTLLTACGGGTSTELPTSTPLPAPEAGLATVTGRVVSIESGLPFKDTIVRLATVARGENNEGGIFFLDTAHSPGVLTDAEGYFAFPNVEAAEYVIVVGDPDGTGIYEIIPDDQGRAKIYNAPADQITDIGDLEVYLRPEGRPTP